MLAGPRFDPHILGDWNTDYPDIPPGSGYGMTLQEIKLLR